MTSPNDVNRHQRIKEIFLQACRCAPAQREVFLQQACDGDEALRREVASLLSHHQNDTDPLLSPVVDRPVLPPEAHGRPTTPMTPSNSPGAATGGSTIWDPARFAPGTVLNQRYRIAGLLGQGGMGEVYRADDLELGQSVALKFLPLQLSSNQKWLDRFRNEVRLARQIAHPNVCRVYDIGQTKVETDDDGDQPQVQTFLSMEYVDGENLTSLLRRIGRLPRGKGVQIARQLCAGLSAAHQKGVLHRDLKPSNIMIDGEGQVRITDFGLAAPLTGLGRDEIRSGTPAYMAPEQITGHEVSIQSDLYSLGLVLYEIFTGRQAFKAEQLADYVQLHTQTSPTSPTRLIDDMDDAVERVIWRCLEKSPADRPTSVLAISAALPGGDPLAAALAAGETPSPEMVAAAGGLVGALSPALAWTALAMVLTGVAALVWQMPKVSLINLVPLEKPPVVLAERAQQLVQDLGFEPTDGDRIYGFREDQNYLDYLERRDRPAQFARHWDQLKKDQPAAIYFWYRSSPKPIVPWRGAERASLSDPPHHEPGMVTVLLDPAGRLLMFERAPDDPPMMHNQAHVTESPNVDWTRLFEAAGLNIDDFEFFTQALARAPRVYADSTVSWLGSFPQDRDNSSTTKGVVRVDAAAYNGRVVYFGIVPEWQPDDQNESVAARAVRQSELLRAALLTTGLIVGVFLAWHNLRIGRGDRKGAFRLATFILVAGLIEHLVGATHTPDFQQELILFSHACGKALYQAAQVWVFYLALEPWVRRLWPQTLITWSRLLRGRFHDPLIGRDMLIGGAFAVWAIFTANFMYWIPDLLDLTPMQPRNAPLDELPQLLGARMGLAAFARSQFMAINLPLLFLLMLVLLRAMIHQVLVWARSKRRDGMDRYMAAAIFVGIWASPGVTQPNPALSATIVVLLWAIATMILMRFGLVALISTITVFFLMTNYPLTANVNVWYAPAGWFSIGIVAAAMLYACLIAQFGRMSSADQLIGR